MKMVPRGDRDAFALLYERFARSLCAVTEHIRNRGFLILTKEDIMSAPYFDSASIGTKSFSSLKTGPREVRKRASDLSTQNTGRRRSRRSNGPQMVDG